MKKNAHRAAAILFMVLLSGQVVADDSIPPAAAPVSSEAFPGLSDAVTVNCSIDGATQSIPFEHDSLSLCNSDAPAYVSYDLDKLSLESKPGAAPLWLGQPVDELKTGGAD